MARTLEPNFIQKTTQNKPLWRSQMSLTLLFEQRFYITEQVFFLASAGLKFEAKFSQLTRPKVCLTIIIRSRSPSSLLVGSILSSASLGRKTGFWLRPRRRLVLVSFFRTSRRLVFIFCATYHQTNELIAGCGTLREIGNLIGFLSW